jgi:hypothetical protein
MYVNKRSTGTSLQKNSDCAHGWTGVVITAAAEWRNKPYPKPLRVTALCSSFTSTFPC